MMGGIDPINNARYERTRYLCKTRFLRKLFSNEIQTRGTQIAYRAINKVPLGKQIMSPLYILLTTCSHRDLLVSRMQAIVVSGLRDNAVEGVVCDIRTLKHSVGSLLPSAEVGTSKHWVAGVEAENTNVPLVGV